MQKHSFILVLMILLGTGANAQDPNRFAFTETTDVEVLNNGFLYSNAWVGGLNYSHFNTIDLDGDGIEDLVVYDRTGNRNIPFLKVPSGASFEYKYAPQYKGIFPESDSWILFRDFNCDGKKDIFYSQNSSIKVLENISTSNDLEFQSALSTTNLRSVYSAGSSNLNVTNGDVPGIIDLDDDGDLDIITFEAGGGSRVEFHRNNQNCGLDYEMYEVCWGHFYESGVSNTVFLDSCTPGKFKGMHSGSTLLPIDLDGDNVKDMLVADVSFKTITALHNTGTKDSAYISSQDTAYPDYDIPVNLTLFPAMFYEDVTHDGVKDLLVSPNLFNTGGENYNNNWLYRNDGVDDHPDFNLEQKNFLFEDMIDFGEGSVPRFVELSGDTLPDLVVANSGYWFSGTVFTPAFTYFLNIGTAAQPKFTIIDTNFMDISSYNLGRSVIPAFGDLNDDGLPDVILGDKDGLMHYLINTGTIGNPSFTLSQAGIGGFDVGNNAAPYLFDMDGDDDLDLIVGAENGTLNYYENQSKTSPSFNLISSNFGGVNVKSFTSSSGHSVPYIYEHDGIINLFVGSADDGVLQFDSVSKVLNLPASIKGQVGTQNLESSNSDQSPFGINKRSGRNQMLFTAAELQAAGLEYGYVTHLSLNVTTSNNGTIQQGININMKNVGYNQITAFESNMESVSTDQIVGFGQGWNILTLERPFLWDGTSNLLIEICFRGNIPNNLVKVEMSNTAVEMHAWGDITNFNTLQANGCNMPFLTGSLKRPNIKLDITPAFVETDNMLFKDGYRNAVAIEDLNFDGYPDGILGNFSGGFSFYLGKEYTIGLEEEPVDTRARLNVYPNPGTGNFTVQRPNAGAATLQIFDLTGKPVKSTQLDQAEVTVDIANQPNGMYLFMITTDGKVWSQKVLKQ